MRETTVPQFEDKSKVIEDNINYNVSFVFQSHINLCGNACCIYATYYIMGYHILLYLL